MIYQEILANQILIYSLGRFSCINSIINFSSTIIQGYDFFIISIFNIYRVDLVITVSRLIYTFHIVSERIILVRCNWIFYIVQDIIFLIVVFIKIHCLIYIGMDGQTIVAHKRLYYSMFLTVNFFLIRSVTLLFIGKNIFTDKMLYSVLNVIILLFKNDVFSRCIDVVYFIINIRRISSFRHHNILMKIQFPSVTHTIAL